MSQSCELQWSPSDGMLGISTQAYRVRIPPPPRLLDHVAIQNTDSVHTQLGDVLTLANRYDEALTHYNYALRYAPVSCFHGKAVVNQRWRPRVLPSPMLLSNVSFGY